MTTQASLEAGTSETDAEQVSSYLRQNPEFFEHNPDLVADLRLAHESGTAVSLIEHQIHVLRDKNRELQTRLLELVDVARDNDRLNQQMHRLIIDMLEADSLAELVMCLSEHMRNDFNADAVCVHISGIDESAQEQGSARLLQADDSIKSMFPEAFKNGLAKCGHLKKEQLDFLFPRQAAAIESAAVVPLGPKAERGLLAIGSCENTRFHSAMGTLFLNHLAELFDCQLRRYVPAV